MNPQIDAYRHGESIMATQQHTLTEDFIQVLAKKGTDPDTIRKLKEKKGIFTSVITGSSGIAKRDPLSEKGIKQALELGEKLFKSNPSLTEIHTSDLTRCIQTAEEVQKVFKKNGKSLNIIQHKELQEIAHGSMDAQIHGPHRNLIYEKFYKKKMQNLENIDPDIKHNSNPPGFDGETFKDVRIRAQKIFFDIAEKFHQPIVMITSNAFIKSLIIESMHKDQPFKPCKPMFYEPIVTGTNILPNAEGYRFDVNLKEKEIKYIGSIKD